MRSVSMFLRRNLRIGRSRDGLLIAVALGTLAIGFLAYIARLSDVTHDAFHEMALVRELFRSGTLPTDDVFAFTPTVSPTVHHEWGTGLVLYWVGGLGPMGLDGLAILRLLLVAAIGLAMYRVARGNGSHPLMFALCAPIVFPMLWVGFATVRAQLFTLLLMQLQLLLQQSDWAGKRKWVIAWALLYVVWLNMHAGFVVGIAMLGLHCIERWLSVLIGTDRHDAPQGLRGCFAMLCNASRWRTAYEQLWHHLLILPILFVGAVINPWGVQYVPYLIRAILMPRPTMLEWQPLWMTHDHLTTMVCYVLSLGALIYVAKYRHWNRLRGWLFCALAAYMALKHLRHGSLYACVWMALLPGWLTATPLGKSMIGWVEHQRLRAVAFASALLIACSTFAIQHAIWQATLPQSDPESPMVYPVAAMNFVEEHGLQGNMMTPFAAGAYVSWRCYPNIYVSIDGRYEVAFQEDVLPKHNRFYGAEEGWERVLAEYSVDMILVQKNAPVRDHLLSKATFGDRWEAIYDDSVFTIFANTKMRLGSLQRVAR